MTTVYLYDLIHTKSAGGNVLTGKNDFTVPRNAACIAAYCEAKLILPRPIAIFKYPEHLLSQIERKAPDVLGFSNYAWNTRLNFAIARHVRTHYPNTTIVMGGPSMRNDGPSIERFLHAHPYIDGYVMYEGERPFTELVKNVSAGGRRRPLHEFEIENLATLDTSGKLKYQASFKYDPLDSYPSPYLRGHLDPFLAEGLIPLFETNRGCPYSCTFCAWGISQLNKLRRYPLDTVYAEIDYVAERCPMLPVWIIADANFGILPRDVDIARKLKEARAKAPGLHSVLTWDSKNTFDRNEEIALILERHSSDNSIANTEKAYMAVQNLAGHVLENIKRSNIKLGELPDRVARLHGRGLKVTTDLLYALPGETFIDAMESLRKSFLADFDYINLGRTLMLPGSELETDASRQSYGLKTKFMLRRGSYGSYHTDHGDVRAIEADEIIVSSRTMKEQESLRLHLLQWLIFFCWNHGRLKPILAYARDRLGRNPADILAAVIDADPNAYPDLAKVMADLAGDLRAVMFDSESEMDEHFADESRWQALLSFVRVELRYNAVLHLDSRPYLQLCNHIKAQLQVDSVATEILQVLASDYVDVRGVMAGDPSPETAIPLSSEAIGYLQGTANARSGVLTLRHGREKQDQMRDFLARNGWNIDPLAAVERLVGAEFKTLTHDQYWHFEGQQASR